MTLSQCREEDKILEPPTVVATKSLEAIPDGTLCRAEEFLCCLLEQGRLAGTHRVIIDSLNLLRKFRNISRSKPAALHKPLQADQQFITSKCRDAGIGRVPIAQAA